MTVLTIVSMAAICGVVWGGLVVLVIYAIRSERRGNKTRTDPPGP